MAFAMGYYRYRQNVRVSLSAQLGSRYDRPLQSCSFDLGALAGSEGGTEPTGAATPPDYCLWFLSLPTFVVLGHYVKRGTRENRIVLWRGLIASASLDR